MLINVDPILSPDILKTLREMGHGDRLVISDINYPAHSNHNRVHRLDGLDMTTVMRAVLSVFPLDSFTVSQGGSPALRMEVDDKPEELTETHKEFIEAVKNNSGPQWKVGSISRQNFYEEAKKAYCIVTTTDARPFGCFIITKGVILPDGKVWS